MEGIFVQVPHELNSEEIEEYRQYTQLCISTAKKNESYVVVDSGSYGWALC